LIAVRVVRGVFVFVVFVFLCCSLFVCLFVGCCFCCVVVVVIIIIVVVVVVVDDDVVVVDDDDVVVVVVVFVVCCCCCCCANTQHTHIQVSHVQDRAIAQLEVEKADMPRLVHDLAGEVSRLKVRFV